MKKYMSLPIFSLLGVMLLSMTTWLFSYKHGLVNTYSDAMSHLNISRLVVDNLQPGLAQLGSVWLPLSQILYLPLIWNNWAWHSGFAGSFISMLAYVLATVGIYKIVRELTAQRWAAVIAVLVFCLNPNLLYLQTTPLTEPLYVALLVASTLFFIRYLKTHQPKHLVLAAVFTALQVLTRYDGWFIAFVMLTILIVSERNIFKQRWSSIVGSSILFGLPTGIAALLWFAWNYLIFGSALYSFTGPYSAHAQQATIEASGGLITKMHLLTSTKAFVFDIIANTGLSIALLSVVGWLIYIIYDKKLSSKLKGLVFTVLIADVIFNILALFAGFSILNLPALHWNPSHTNAGMYFNVRYGITALPFIAVGFGLLISRARKYLVYILILIIMIQGGSLLSQGLITVKDGTIGSSAFANDDISNALKSRVKPSDKVIMSSSTYNGVMFRSGLDLHQYIHEGVSTEWKAAIADPDHHANWVVVANGDFGDPVYNSLVKQEKSSFLRYYYPVFHGDHANLYERRSKFERYVSADNSKLIVNDKAFVMKGVNDYDLAYQTDEQIKQTFINLQKADVNTIRFWMFGDGIYDGFQPTVGGLGEQKTAKTDYIFKLAHEYKIRLVPTLNNNYNDYGGADQYLKWAGIDPAQHDQFYSNSIVIGLYKNYLNHILTHKNELTGTSYINDSAVVGWDILNEPRSNNTRDIVDWTKNISSYIKQLDTNHLVTISIDKPTIEAGYADICGMKTIDFCSLHIYPQEPNISSYANQADLQVALSTNKATANSIGKPVVVTELGANKALQPFGQNPLNVLDSTISSLNQLHYSGYLIWNYSQEPDASFGFSPDGSNGYTLSGLKTVLHN